MTAAAVIFPLFPITLAPFSQILNHIVNDWIGPWAILSPKAGWGLWIWAYIN